MERIVVKDENALLIDIVLEDKKYSLKVKEDYVVLKPYHSDSDFDKLFKDRLNGGIYP